MDIHYILLEELKGRKHIRGTGDNSNFDVYMRITEPAINHKCKFICYTSSCSGGAWHNFGSGVIQDDHVILTLKTVSDLVYRKRGTEEFRFDFVDPEFPDNMNLFLCKAAVNARRALTLGTDRISKHRSRRLRHKQAKDIYG